jgi:F-type H+-transporting ATPase subunit b
MPQLEQIDSFIGQIFWLLTSLAILYFFLAKYAVPRLSSTEELRNSNITNNINLAETLKNQSKEMAEEFEKKLNSSKSESFKIVSEANKNAASNYDSKILEVENEIKKSLEASEKEINLQKDKAFAELKAEVASLVNEVVEKVAGSTKIKPTIAKVAKA